MKGGERTVMKVSGNGRWGTAPGISPRAATQHHLSFRSRAQVTSRPVSSGCRLPIRIRISGGQSLPLATLMATSPELIGAGTKEKWEEGEVVSPEWGHKAKAVCYLRISWSIMPESWLEEVGVAATHSRTHRPSITAATTWREGDRAVGRQ